MVPVQDQNGIRLNKYLSEAGLCSRREADRLICAGRVTVDGAAAQPGQRILPASLVCVDGSPVDSDREDVLLLFYKPRGIVCSAKRQGQETTVTEYIHYPVRIYPVGRLDKESEGLLLMTNQGELTNRLLKASGCHEKEYLVEIDRPVTRDFLERMSKGVRIRKMEKGEWILDKVTNPCYTQQTGRNAFRIILTQGLNRQIRRMCEALGCHVTKLKRVRIVNLTLEGLSPGQYRPATDQERKVLYRETGLL